MKKTMLAITLLCSVNIQATSYLVTLDDKHYKESVVIKDVVNDNNVPSTGFNLNDLSNVTYGGNTDWTAGCQCHRYLGNETLAEGWNYLEFRFSNWANVAAGAGISVNGSHVHHYYGNNNGALSYTNVTIVSALVKLPEGYVWYAKAGVWNQGNPQDLVDGVSDGNPSFKLNITDGDIIQFKTYSGTPSGTTSYTIWNNSAGNEYNYLTELGLTN